MTWTASKAEIHETTEQVIRYMAAKAPANAADATVFIYNHAMRDACDALGVFAEKNPQYRIALQAGQNELRRNFFLERKGKADD